MGLGLGLGHEAQRAWLGLGLGLGLGLVLGLGSGLRLGHHTQHARQRGGRGRELLVECRALAALELQRRLLLG